MWIERLVRSRVRRLLTNEKQIALKRRMPSLESSFQGIDHLGLCQREGLGRMEGIVYPGLDPQEVQLDFQPPKENFVAVIEGRLRHAPGAGKIFSGGLLTFFSLGAKLWYLIWYYVLTGRRRRNRILKTRYGPQYKQ